jgi:hypothetical protein
VQAELQTQTEEQVLVTTVYSEQVLGVVTNKNKEEKK